jgi:hypothetical protein
VVDGRGQRYFIFGHTTLSRLDKQTRSVLVASFIAQPRMLSDEDMCCTGIYSPFFFLI